MIKRIQNRPALINRCFHDVPRFRHPLRVSLIILLLGLALAPVQAAPITMKSAKFDPVAGSVPRTGLPSEKLSKAKPSGATIGAGESRLVLVQWPEGFNKAHRDAFKAAGGHLISPIANKTYLALVPASMDLSGVTQGKVMAKAAAPAWADEMAPEWKLDPAVAASLATKVTAKPSDATLARYNVQIVYTGGEAATRKALQTLSSGAALHSAWRDFETWTIQAQPDAIETLARLNGVMWIEPSYDSRPGGERAGLVMANQVTGAGTDVAAPGAYATWLKKVGLSGAGVTVQIMDTGLSQGIATNVPGTSHPDFIGRIVGIDNPTNDPLGNDVGGHGTINASIIMGQPKAINSLTGMPYIDPLGYLLGQGVAPNAKIFATKIFDNQENFIPGSSMSVRTFDSLVQSAEMVGAHLSANSWGEPLAAGVYDATAQLFDRLTRRAGTTGINQSMTFVFCAGNNGQTGSQTIWSPGSAKNVITVGAGENSDKGELDGSYCGPNESNDIRDIVDFSSRGPTADGRLSPTLFAPGVHVTGVASDDRAYIGNGVSGRVIVQPGEDASARKYYPANQNFYTWCSGTSQATPTVAGAVALLYEYCKKAFGYEPSPALAKAMLVAGAVDTAGGNRNFVSTNSGEKLINVPNNDAGWGRCSLAGIVDKPGSSFFVVDQATTLTFTNETRTYQVWVTDSSKPFKVVLAWTDVPASLIPLNALVNDLDLTVSSASGTWIGNSFANGYSVQGGYIDGVNNLECVFIKNPIPGLYTITVTAKNVQGDAFMRIDGDPAQDFALFATNAQTTPPATPSVAFNQPYYTTGSSPLVMLCDPALAGLGTTKVKLYNSNHTDTETLTLSENPVGTGYFTGLATLSTWGAPTPGDGVITATHYNYVYVSYTDKTKVTRTARSLIDVKPATVLSQQITELGPDYATIKVVTSEAVIMTLTYGPFPSQLNNTRTSMAMNTVHEFTITPLIENQAYFYKFTTTDQASNSATDDNGGLCYTFQTPLAQNDFYDNFDNGAQPGWTHYANSGIDDWVIYPNAYDADLAYNNVPNGAWVSKDSATSKDVCLVSPAITIKPQARLTFNQWYKFQAVGKPYGFDGGLLEISTDNGTSWSDLGGKIVQTSHQWYQAGTYDAILSTGTGNPLGGRMAWTGRSWDKFHSVTWKSNINDTSASTRRHDYAYPVNVDLSAYAGQQAKFRWRLGTNNALAGDRWIIDDVKVWSPAPSVNAMARIRFDSPKFNGGQGTIRFTLTDSALSAATGVQPSPQDFLLASTQFPQGITLYRINGLQMIDPAGIWEGYLTVTINPAPPAGYKDAVFINGLLNVNEGEWLKLIYTDSDIGDGTAYDVSDSTTLDWTVPTLLSNEVSQVRNHDFTITLTADEAVTATIRIGPSMSNLNQSYSMNAAGTQLSVKALNLTDDTPYYYTVLIRDVAGNTTYDDNGGFGYGVRTNVNHLYMDTLEPRPAFQWSQTVNDGIGIWTVVTGRLNHSASNSWLGSNTPGRNDCSLMLTGLSSGDNGIEIRDGYTLRFWHNYQFDPGLDGGVIEISTDSGATWQDLGPNIVGGNPYNYVISWEYGSALGGRSAWSGSMLGGVMRQVTVDLSPYAGVGRLIRWRLACDQTAQSQTGWFIDDIAIDAYGPAMLDFPAKPSLLAPLNNKNSIPYDQDMNLTWNTTAHSNKYRVYVGTDPANLTQLVETGATQYPVSQASLKPGTVYYWRVVAVYDLENPKNPLITASDVHTFKTQIIDPIRFANFLIGKDPSLTDSEKLKGDYNGDGKVDITDLINNVQRR